MHAIEIAETGGPEVLRYVEKPTPTPGAGEVLIRADAIGVNYIDTADVYTKGASETMVGELIKPTRHDWVLATKLGNPMSQRPNEGHYSRSWMLRGVDAALARARSMWNGRAEYLKTPNVKVEAPEGSPRTTG